MEVDGSYYEAFYNLGRILVRQGKEVEAAEKFRRCLELRPDHDKAKTELSKCKIETNFNNLQDDARILVVMDEGIGNMVMLTPTLQAIRKTLPNCHLTIG